MRFSNLSYFLNLIRVFAWFDFKLKYYGSIFGIFWSILKPLAMLSILYFIFSNFFKIQANFYHLQLLLGIIIWNFFVDTTKDSMSNFKAKSPILLNTQTPPFILPISTLCHSFLTFIINFLVFILIASFSKINLDFNIFHFLLLLILLLFFNLGISLIIIPLYLKFSDFGHIWDIFLQLFFWLNPIAYHLNMIPDKYLIFYQLNPLAQLINNFRSLIIFDQSLKVNLSFLLIIIILGLGILIFKKNIKKVIEYM